MSERVLVVPGVYEERRLGSTSPRERLLLELPHGATRTADYRSLEARLNGPFPADLIHFFYVNTDVGSPELAWAIAERWVAAAPEREAIWIRSLIPRTFVDCNRRIDAAAQGTLTAGLAPYVHDPADQALLRELHAAYVSAIERLYAEVCGSGGYGLAVHTYAPRSVDVQVSDRIVADLHAAWEPGGEGRWPLRPEVDLITRTPEGERVAPAALISRLEEGFRAIGVPLDEGTTYPMHPATQAWRFANRYPEQVLCFEVRRDLLATSWSPFEEMPISAAKVAPLAVVFAAALERGD